MHNLADFIRVYDEALPADVCAQILDTFHTNQAAHIQNGASARNVLAESNWTELDITRLLEAKLQQSLVNQAMYFKDRYEKECQLHASLPLPSKLSPLIVKRYQAESSDQFQAHFDSVGPAANRFMVFLWYLNNVAEGGETEFLDLGIKVAPKAGRLLIFPPYWMYFHTGCPPVSEDKYILSTYCLW